MISFENDYSEGAHEEILRRLAGVEPATIAYWYTTGKISVRKTGKIIRIPREAFEQWLLKRKEKGVV